MFAENTDEIKSLKKIWVDGTYRGEDWHTEVKRDSGIELEVSKNPEGVKGFVAIAKRWVVERTFGWSIQAQRLAREYEKLAESSEAMIYLNMIRCWSGGWLDTFQTSSKKTALFKAFIL